LDTVVSLQVAGRPERILQSDGMTAHARVQKDVRRGDETPSSGLFYNWENPGMSATTLAFEAAGIAGAIPPPASTDSVLAGLTKYIPTESVTLYVATISAQGAITSVAPWFGPKFAYGFFVFLTPVLVVVLFLRQLAVAGRNWHIPPSGWCWWRAVAATLAFAVWALAVPGNPFIDPTTNAAGGVLAGLAATVVSGLLNLVAPFFEQPTPPAS
jgi:hypothetical protein